MHGHFQIREKKYKKVNNGKHINELYLQYFFLVEVIIVTYSTGLCYSLGCVFLGFITVRAVSTLGCVQSRFSYSLGCVLLVCVRSR